MPFKSQAQLRKFASLMKEGKISPDLFKKWLQETDSVSKLPNRLKKK